MQNKPMVKSPAKIKLRRRFFFLIFGLAWVLFSIPFFLFGLHEWQINRRFETEAIQVPATVLSKFQKQKWDSKEKRNDTYYYVRYHFKTKEQVEHDKEESLSKDSWDKIQDSGTIEIQYLKDDLNYSRVVGTASDIGSYLMLGFSFLMFLVGIVFIAGDLKKRFFEGSILKNGIETTATITDIRESSMTVNNIAQLDVAYSFKDRMGRSYSGESKDLKPALVANTQVGSHCKICYDKDDPNKNLLVQF